MIDEAVDIIGTVILFVAPFVLALIVIILVVAYPWLLLNGSHAAPITERTPMAVVCLSVVTDIVSAASPSTAIRLIPSAHRPELTDV